MSKKSGWKKKKALSCDGKGLLLENPLRIIPKTLLRYHLRSFLGSPSGNPPERVRLVLFAQVAQEKFGTTQQLSRLGLVRIDDNRLLSAHDGILGNHHFLDVRL